MESFFVLLGFSKIDEAGTFDNNKPNLIEKGVKNIFVPSIQSIAPKIYNCSKIRGLPDLVRNVIKADINIIEPTLDKSAKNLLMSADL